MLLRIYTLILLVLFSTKLYSEDIPVIVIAPSKKLQSISTVGTSMSILDENFFKNSTDQIQKNLLMI